MTPPNTSTPSSRAAAVRAAGARLTALQRGDAVRSLDSVGGLYSVLVAPMVAWQHRSAR